MRRQTVSLAVAWLLVAVIVFLSLTPDIVELPRDPSGKYSHMGAYALVMCFFVWAYGGTRRACITAGLALLALGITVELLQGRIGYRTFELGDMAADVIGIGLGCVAALTLPFGAVSRKTL